MNRRLTIGLVVVFAALAVYVLVVQVPKDNASSATPTVAPTAYLWPTLRADQVKAVHVVDRVLHKQTDLVKDASGSWSLTSPGPQPASQVLAASNVSALMTLATDGTITTATDLSAFGVLSPTLTVEVDMADGTSLKAAVGDKTPTGSDYYTLRAGETQVVLLSTAAQGTLESLVTTPPVVPPTSTTTPGAAGDCHQRFSAHPTGSDCCRGHQRGRDVNAQRNNGAPGQRYAITEPFFAVLGGKLSQEIFTPI
jgi:hypothetical protein